MTETPIAFTGPTIVEVWAPWCAACRALEPDLVSVAAEFSGSVRLVQIDASREPGLAGALDVKGTPTIIGFRDGEEVLRFTGRRTRGELHELFHATAEGTGARGVGAVDTGLRFGAGATLIVLGLVSGPTWPLAAIGVVVVGWGIVSQQRSRAHVGG